MLEATHKKIAREIAKALSLEEHESSLLEVGSVSPDSWADFPHHRDKESEIEKRILEARARYLENDDECYSVLGIALHYIQDMWTLSPRIEDKHTEWEKRIHLSPILDKSKLKKEIERLVLPKKAKEEYLQLVDRCSSRVNGEQLLSYVFDNYRQTDWSAPVLDLNFAYMSCLEVARNVFLPREQSEEMQRSVDALHEKLDGLSRAHAMCNERIKSLEQKTGGFPRIYFEQGWSIGRFDPQPLFVPSGVPRTRIVDAVQVSNLFGAVWNRAKDDPNERERVLTVRPKQYTSKVRKKVEEKRKHCLWRGKEIEVEREMEVDVVVEFFRLSITGDESYYVDCPSLEIAHYVRAVLTHLDARSSASSLNSLREFPIPLKAEHIRKLLDKYGKDKAEMERERANLQRLQRKMQNVTKEISRKIRYWDNLRDINASLKKLGVYY